jgi:serine/threonine-protein kinase
MTMPTGDLRPTVTDEASTDPTARTVELRGTGRAAAATVRSEPLDAGEPALGDADHLIGATIGRYRVLAQLGAGGMGVVYRAHDPVLDRTVALKVLPPLDESRRAVLEARLRREAQALARLDHHNVLAVYDVGIAHASLFVAMQFVDGTTLEHAIAAQHLPARRILAHYIAAGRGLAAAHAAGIVHRDVKPSNILVDRSGRVYVGDFGLARGENDAETASGESPGPLLATGMTRAGSILGTPLYMSPEQHRGEPTTTRSDQFSFCVALWRDAFGAHPFVTGPWQADAALEAMERDAIVEPVRPQLPARAVRALRRGLRHDPAARWPSMTALIAELEPVRRAPWLAGIAGGVIAGGVAAALALGGSRGDPCAGAADRLDQIATPARRRAISDGFAATRLAYAGDTAARVIAAIDGYGRAWAGMRIDACRADQARHQPVFDRRTACLDHRLAGLDAALATLTGVGGQLIADVVDRAGDVVAALPPIEDCGDLARLAAAPAEPEDPVVRIRIDQLGAELERQRASLAAGVLVGAVDKAEALVASVRGAGWGPLLGQALHHASEAHQSVNEVDLAIDRMREASVEAGRARDDAAAAAAMVRVAYLLAERSKAAEALAVVADAEVNVLRAGDPPRLRGRLEIARGDALGHASRFAESRAAFDKAIELTRRDPRHDELEVAAMLTDEAEMLKTAAQPRPARDALREAERIFAARLGSGHPRLTAVHNTLGSVLLQLGDFPAARAEYAAAGAIVEARFPSDSLALAKQQGNLAMLELRQGHLGPALAGYEAVHRRLEQAVPEHPETYQALYMIGAIQLEQSRYDDALATMQRVLAYRLEHLGDANVATANVLDGIANVYQARDDYPHAIEARKRGLAIREKALGPDNPDVVLSLDALGFIALDTGDCAQATALARRSLDILERSHSSDHLKINALDTLGSCARHAGRLAEARATLEQALGYAEVQGNGRVEQRASLRIDLAEVLWKAGDRAGARKRVEEALAIYERAGNKPGVAEQRKWLAQHRL